MPELTNCEANGENVDMELRTGLGTAPMTQSVTGDVTSISNGGHMQGGNIVAKLRNQDAPESSQQQGTIFVIGWENAHHYISVIKCILQSI